MTKIRKFIEHNLGICIGLFLTPCVILYAYGCQSQTVSLINPSVRVTRDVLIAEVDSFLAMAEARFADLDRQDLVKGTMFNSMLELVRDNPVSPPGIALLLTNLLGLGAVMDNIRKRTLIDVLKKKANNVPPVRTDVPDTS